MSPKRKIKLNLLRKKIDKIDLQLLQIIKKRTEIIKKVLLLKSNKNEVIDKKRISIILRRIKIYGKGKKYDCVVGVSGGTDSSYLLYVTKKLR